MWSISYRAVRYGVKEMTWYFVNAGVSGQLKGARGTVLRRYLRVESNKIRISNTPDDDRRLCQ
jgi:hypothetical protein